MKVNSKSYIILQKSTTHVAKSTAEIPVLKLFPLQILINMLFLLFPVLSSFLLGALSDSARLLPCSMISARFFLPTSAQHGSPWLPSSVHSLSFLLQSSSQFPVVSSPDPFSPLSPSELMVLKFIILPKICFHSPNLLDGICVSLM